MQKATSPSRTQGRDVNRVFEYWNTLAAMGKRAHARIWGVFVPNYLFGRTLVSPLIASDLKARQRVSLSEAGTSVTGAGLSTWRAGYGNNRGRWSTSFGEWHMMIASSVTYFSVFSLFSRNKFCRPVQNCSNSNIFLSGDTLCFIYNNWSIVCVLPACPPENQGFHIPEMEYYSFFYVASIRIFGSGNVLQPYNFTLCRGRIFSSVKQTKIAVPQSRQIFVHSECRKLSFFVTTGLK